MNTKKPKKLSMILGLYLLISIVGFSIGVLIWAYHTAIHTINSELLNSFQQKQTFAESIMERELEFIGQIFWEIRRSESFSSEVFQKNQEKTEDILYEILDSHPDRQLDILFVIMSEGSVLANVSSPFFDTDPLLHEIMENKGSLLSAGQIMRLKKDSIDLTIMLMASRIIQKQTGRLVGTLFGGIILNDNLSILEAIKRKTKSEIAAFFETKDIIGSTDLLESHNNQNILKSLKIHNDNHQEAYFHLKGGMLINHKKLFLMGQPTSLGIVVAIRDQILTDTKHSYLKKGSILLVFSMIFLLFTSFIIRKLTFPSLEKLLHYSEDVSSGNLQAHYVSGGIIEFNQLGQMIEQMVKTIRDEIEERRRAEKKIRKLNTELEQRVMERTAELADAMESLWGEMELAKKIQTVLLPKRPEISGYEIAASCEPSEQVGGDYYDVISVGGYDWIVIGDVSGHGVTAGLIMMMVQTSIHTVLNKNPKTEPSQLLSIINKTVYGNIELMDESKHMTIVVLAAGRNGKFSFSGLHEDILIRRAETGKVDIVESDGMWIGLEPDISGYLRDDTLQMEPGDCMVLFTDGITEAWCEGGKLFGDKRLIRIIEDSGEQSAAEIRENIISALESCETPDDVTMVVMKRV